MHNNVKFVLKERGYSSVVGQLLFRCIEAPLGQLQHGLEVYTSLRETINHFEEGVRAVSEIIIRVVGGNGFFCPESGCIITSSLS